MKYTKEQIRSNIPFFGSLFWRGFKMIILIGAFGGGIYFAGVLYNYFPARKQHVVTKEKAIKKDKTPVLKNKQVNRVKEEEKEVAQNKIKPFLHPKKSTLPAKETHTKVVKQKLSKQEPSPTPIQQASNQELYLKNQETLRRLSGK